MSHFMDLPNDMSTRRQKYDAEQAMTLYTGLLKRERLDAVNALLTILSVPGSTTQEGIPMQFFLSGAELYREFQQYFGGYDARHVYEVYAWKMFKLFEQFARIKRSGRLRQMLDFSQAVPAVKDMWENFRRLDDVLNFYYYHLYSPQEQDYVLIERENVQIGPGPEGRVDEERTRAFERAAAAVWREVGSPERPRRSRPRRGNTGRLRRKLF